MTLIDLQDADKVESQVSGEGGRFLIVVCGRRPIRRAEHVFGLL